MGRLAVGGAVDLVLEARAAVGQPGRLVPDEVLEGPARLGGGDAVGRVVVPPEFGREPGAVEQPVVHARHVPLVAGGREEPHLPGARLPGQGLAVGREAEQPDRLVDRVGH
ncbi:MAG: hypothetical protein K2X91_16205, partial [Thermoleophilia bacterium]|nr:hypothetical protein [Thermoleophilia bacterium]